MPCPALPAASPQFALRRKAAVSIPEYEPYIRVSAGVTRAQPYRFGKQVEIHLPITEQGQQKDAGADPEGVIWNELIGLVEFFDVSRLSAVSAVLSAIILPELLLPGGTLDVSLGNERLLICLVAALAAWRTKSAVITIFAGMATLIFNVTFSFIR